MTRKSNILANQATLVAYVCEDNPIESWLSIFCTHISLSLSLITIKSDCKHKSAKTIYFCRGAVDSE